MDLVEEIGRDSSEMADGSVERGRSVEDSLGEDGPAGTENVVVERVVEGGDLHTVESDDIAMAMWHALDESVHAQASKGRTSLLRASRHQVLDRAMRPPTGERPDSGTLREHVRRSHPQYPSCSGPRGVAFRRPRPQALFYDLRAESADQPRQQVRKSAPK